MSSVSLKPSVLSTFTRGEEGQVFVVGRAVGMIETAELDSGAVLPMIYTDPEQAIGMAVAAGRSLGVQLIAYEAVLTMPLLH